MFLGLPSINSTSIISKTLLSNILNYEKIKIISQLIIFQTVINSYNAHMEQFNMKVFFHLCGDISYFSDKGSFYDPCLI